MAGYRGFKRFKGSWIALRAMNFICHFAAVVGAFKIKGRLFFIKPHNRADSAKKTSQPGLRPDGNAFPLSRFAGLPPKGETTHYDLCVAGAPSSTAVTDSLDFRVADAPLQIQFA